MFTKTEIEYMNTTKLWKNSIEFILQNINNYDCYTIYKIKNEDKYFAINMKTYITDEINKQLESEIVKELHNNRISNK
tara:strand:+ start:231 stop:464 length:234 start_codon:yes stop_codon:yes gene_type:complete